MSPTPYGTKNSTKYFSKVSEAGFTDSSFMSFNFNAVKIKTMPHIFPGIGVLKRYWSNSPEPRNKKIYKNAFKIFKRW